MLIATAASPASAQGSRKDDVVLGPSGHPVAGATITVCQATATGTPCSPLATIYTDATLTTTSPNPFQSDGIGNYHFYAPAGRYLLQISSPQINGTVTYPDVILPADVSSTGTGNNISAFGLTLGGNLSVAGNAAVSGTLTATNFNPGAFTPSTLQVSGNGCFGGPRPYIDVTCPAYGARGDSGAITTTGSITAGSNQLTVPSGAIWNVNNGLVIAGADPTGNQLTAQITAINGNVLTLNVTAGTTVSSAQVRDDDTYSIAAAMNVSCASTLGASGAHPTVYFPPGIYFVAQTQGSSTTPVLPSCFGQQMSGPESGNVLIVASNKGTNPSPAPLLAVGSTSGYRNLSFSGYNEALLFSSVANVNLNGVAALTTFATGQTDNAAVIMKGTFEVTWKGGFISSNQTSVPNFLFTDNGVGQPTYLLDLEDISLGPGSDVIQERGNCVSLAAAYTFKNIVREGANTDFLTFNQTGSNGCQYDGLILEQIQDADNTLTTPALINFDQPNGFLNGVSIRYALAASGIAIRNTASSSPPTNVEIKGGLDFANGVVDGSGNPAGKSIVVDEFSGGRDHISSTLQEALAAPFSNSIPSIEDRYFKNGAGYSTFGLDGNFGELFGDGTTPGYSGQIIQTSPETLDVGFAKLLPPTGFTGTATTGGSVAANTYYGYLYASTSASCGGGVQSTFAYAPAVVVSGSNNAINFTWTDPAASPLSGSITGYCIAIFSSSIGPGNYLINAIYVFGANTTSFLYTGQAEPTTSPVYPTGSFQAQHRFTSSSLGVNTTSPQYNLDVNGSAAVNSLNQVQKAERFSGSDAAAKINACLTAASTTSSLCDARGLTGSLTGASHIQIPAGTVLLWGSGQLAINDTTNNDAVELMGDGSALIGYQESGAGTIPRPDSAGFVSCVPSGCTAVKNPNAATRNVDWIHITGMNLEATGSGSKVIDLTSVGHADIESNRLIMGTGGSSYGVFGDTSTGGFDSTNTLIKHNEFDPQFQNDRCLHLAGVFNVIEMEQNTCILPASNTGTVCFELAKDSSGNYPNNDEFYGNDCEASSTSFGQIGYNIINADSVTIGPNNRCENVYSCFQFPTDGSAVGIHILDPYISVSATEVVKPNEPSTSQVAIDNNGPNWLPSMHFGMNDLAGRNLLGNAGFEGWANSTTLYYWGGVGGTNINQAGSGIYAQQSSGSSPADSTTQGSYSVKIGDNATAGLGINSGCIQVDATMNYTLAFRVVASSTSVNFRPGFRFYSDPNCTEADKITSVATNARVLTPTNYAGTSALAGTGPNWQSSNASLTYNNGITCNCNVTGADWQVAAANSWTPTRNFAVTFRVPNAYASSSTVAQSMRVFILENTAANPNTIFVDDAVLSQGPVSPSVPMAAAVPDSGNPTIYGNLGVNGSLTVGTLPATLTTGTPTTNDCAAFAGTNVQDSGSPCPTQFTKFAMGFLSAGQAPSSTNAVDVSLIYLPNIQFSHVTVDVSTTDSSGSDFYGWAITDLSGNVKCSITAVNLTTGGASDQSCTQGTVTLTSGAYVFAFTGNATTAKIAYSGTAPLALSSAVSSSTSSSGAMTFPISIPSAGVTYSGYGLPAIILH
ncbi:MAG TPA: hypothetical protein VMD78_10595 [Candidatus Baltobacteraceae bacterium]|nr:hypothetical protein [Candidatus Baltobacteraceae bacterium]